MATYSDLFNIISDSQLRNKVAVAVIKKAQTLLDGTTPTPNEVVWASNAISNPNRQAEKILAYVLAANSGSTVTAIKSASDSAIQSNVNDAVDALITGGVTN